LIIHERLIRFWLDDFCGKITDELLKESNVESLKKLEKNILIRTVGMIKEKTATFPKLIRLLLNFVLKRFTPQSDQLHAYLKLIKEKDEDEIKLRINELIASKLIEASNRVIPFWVIYLIPINTILFILLWFI